MIIIKRLLVEAAFLFPAAINAGNSHRQRFIRNIIKTDSVQECDKIIILQKLADAVG